ncbi:MAG: hypothetical protein P1P84_19020 [Deferrisomatales bacterium]|nr:hypothetical protein [Deferrisomatales bacterium]
MEQVLLAQACTALALLLLTPATLRRGLPSTGRITRLVATLRKSLTLPQRPRRSRGCAMRGARPWWE